MVCSRAAAQEERETGQRFGARLIIWGAPDYPPLLREIPDPPAVLWAKGDMALLSRLCVAVVGARAASAVSVDEIVARASEVRIDASDTDRYAHDVGEVVLQLEALRQAVEETRQQ